MDKDVLVGKIYEDIQSALSVIDATHSYNTAEVTSVSVRVGQRSEYLKDLTDIGPDPFSAPNGWILDFSFTPAQNTQRKVSFYEKVAVLPLETVKGIGTTWAKKLKMHGLIRIGDLGALQWDDFQELSQTLDTVRVFEWCHAVQVLQQKVPEWMVEKCAGKSIEELLHIDFDRLFPRAPITDLTGFIHLCTGFTAVLDRDVLSTIIL
jgi:hypothetical protein